MLKFQRVTYNRACLVRAYLNAVFFFFCSWVFMGFKFVYLSIYVSICMQLCLSVRLPCFKSRSICLTFRSPVIMFLFSLSVCFLLFMSIYNSTQLSFCLSVWLCLCLCVCLSVCLCVCLSVCRNGFKLDGVSGVWTPFGTVFMFCKSYE